nr:UDP-glucuronosyltransferase [Nilaparvata lugens]
MRFLLISARLHLPYEMLADTSLLLWTIIVIGSSICPRVENARIFALFPTPSYSHQQPMLALSKALASRGHNLTVITTNPNEYPIENHQEIDVGHFYGQWKMRQKEIGFSLQARRSAYEWLSQCSLGVNHFCELVLGSNEVQQLIRSNNNNHSEYDLILYEPLYPCTLGFVHLFNNPPVVAVLSMPSHVYTDFMLGNTINPSYMPLHISPLNDNLNLVQRLWNTYLYLYLLYLQFFYINDNQSLIMKKYFGEETPSIEALQSNISLVLYSNDLSTTYPKPLQPHVIPVGALHLTDNKPIPEDFKKWMDEAEEGVIIFSLGSNMQGTSVSEEKRAIFVQAFSMYPQVRVIWKWESDQKIPGLTNNVLTTKWLPQQDILAHPKVRFFMSQVGLQSMQEAIHNAVPVLGVPIFGDQDFNARKLASEGAGIVVEFESLTLDILNQSIHDLLTHTSYKDNMQRLSRISKDKQSDALSTAVWWVEYVLRHKGAHHLRPAVIKLKWYQAYLLDVLAITLILIASGLIVINWTLKRLFSMLTSYSNKPKQD